MRATSRDPAKELQGVVAKVGFSSVCVCTMSHKVKEPQLVWLLLLGFNIHFKVCQLN